MCGIVGMAGDIRNAEKKMFRDMLVMDQVRGFDSTGMCSVPINPTKLFPYEVIKDVGPAQHLWEFAEPNKFDWRGVFKGFPKVLIGHNRAATVGKVNEKNAHPFANENIVGVHNGSLVTWKVFDPENKFEVDSEALYDTMKREGPDFVWKNLHGAAALVWWDDKEEKLSIIRNKERPLYYHWSKNGKTLFWASEFWMIHAAALRNGVSLKTEKGQSAPTFSQFPVDTLHTFKPTSVNCKPLEVRELEKKVWHQANQQWNNGNSGSGHGNKPSYGFKPSYTLKKVFQGEWKKSTVRCRIAPSNLFIKNLRSVTEIRSPQDWAIFRGTLVYTKGKTKEEVEKGRITIYAVNNTDFDYLSTAVRHSSRLVLTGKVRESTNENVNHFFVGSGCVKVASSKINTPSQLIVRDSSKVVPLHKQTYQTSDGSLVDKATMEMVIRQAGNTCAYCDSTLDIEESDSFHWLTKNSCLCPECNENWGDSIYLLGVQS